jgi:hypothetical protein
MIKLHINVIITIILKYFILYIPPKKFLTYSYAVKTLKFQKVGILRAPSPFLYPPGYIHDRIITLRKRNIGDIP